MAAIIIAGDLVTALPDIKRYLLSRDM